MTELEKFELVYSTGLQARVYITVEQFNNLLVDEDSVSLAVKGLLEFFTNSGMLSAGFMGMYKNKVEIHMLNRDGSRRS